jgi:hypothetical protein
VPACAIKTKVRTSLRSGISKGELLQSDRAVAYSEQTVAYSETDNRDPLGSFYRCVALAQLTFADMSGPRFSDQASHLTYTGSTGTNPEQGETT